MRSRASEREQAGRRVFVSFPTRVATFYSVEIGTFNYHGEGRGVGKFKIKKNANFTNEAFRARVGCCSTRLDSFHLRDFFLMVYLSENPVNENCQRMWDTLMLSVSNMYDI